MSIVDWAKAHKTLLLVFGGLIILYFLFSALGAKPFALRSTSSGSIDSFDRASTGYTSVAPTLEIPKVGDSGSTQRVVIKNSNLSLLVKDVKKTGDEVLAYTKSIGGFMVSTSYNRPQESPFGEVAVRVPTERLDEALDKFRSLALKVTSENLIGDDVTDQYKDIDANLATLEKTKAKFEDFLTRATNINDSLSVQREITTLQAQIDALKGQKKAIEQNAALTKVTVFLSTDELALPYTPDKTFRASLIFKQAVRSMLGTLQALGELLIWISVYAVIWVPLLLGYFGYRRWKRNRI